MIIKPLQDFVLLEEIKEEVTKAGIVLTEATDLETPNLAKVLALGPDVGRRLVQEGMLISNQLQEGVTVLFKRHLFDETTLDGKPYLLGREEGIVAVIEQTNDVVLPTGVKGEDTLEKSKLELEGTPTS